MKFKVIVRKIDDQFICYIPTLHLSSKSNNLNDAYEKLSNRVDELYADYRELGIADRLDSDTSTFPPLVINQLKRFTIKTLIGSITVSVFFLFTIVISTKYVSSKFVIIDSKIKQKIDRIFPEDPKERAEKEEKLKKKIKKLKPYATEIKKLFQ